MENKTPLCTKIIGYKIVEIIVIAALIFFDIMFILNVDEGNLVLITAIILFLINIYFVFDIIYWIIQPYVLIYQYETGIIIKRNIKIEYKEIESISYKRYWVRDTSRINSTNNGMPYQTHSMGSIYIKLKNNKTYTIRNVYYPIDAMDKLWKIKKQKKFR